MFGVSLKERIRNEEICRRIKTIDEPAAIGYKPHRTKTNGKS